MDDDPHKDFAEKPRPNLSFLLPDAVNKARAKRAEFKYTPQDLKPLRATKEEQIALAKQIINDLKELKDPAGLTDVGAEYTERLEEVNLDMDVNNWFEVSWHRRPAWPALQT